MASTNPKNHGELLNKFKEQVEDFLTDTEDSRKLAERDRDYRDGKQWTQDEKAKLLKRRQAPIVVNRVRPKVEGLKGLIVQQATDPKAYARTPKHERAAEVVTDGLRYVADNNDFDQLKLQVSDNYFVEGYGAAIVEIDGKSEIKIINIPWDRYYYDIHSRRLDFQDKRYDGIILWMYVEDVKEQFGKDPLESEIDSEHGDETFDDRPLWIDKKRDRVRVCQHFYRDKGRWKMCYFTGQRFLIPPQDSPYIDEFGEPINPIEAQAANIDRDNNRYGEVRAWIDLQDEINHRRSKFLHLLNSRQTASRKGAIPDVDSVKRELSKPDGHIEYNGEKGDFEVLSTNDMKDGQFLLYQDGKNEIDAVGFNAQLSGERQGDLSGRAIVNLQQASINELSSLFSGFTSWEKRIYRQCWFRMKQFWTREKWIRVLDSQEVRWVGFNQQITNQQFLEEQINDESQPLEIRQQTALIYQQMAAANDPILQQIREVRNEIAELDMDIMIEVSLDSINVQREEFEMLMNVAQTRPEVPFEELLKLMPTIRQKTKDQIIQSIQSQRQAMAQGKQAQAQLDAQETQSKIEKNMADAANKEQNALQTKKQTEMMDIIPPSDTGKVF